MVILNPIEATRNIEIIQLEVSTSLSIVAPSSVNQGEAFNVVGLLLRLDTNAPVPGAMITVSHNGITLGNVFTDDLGRYLLTTSIDTVGTYVLTASFAGSSVLAATTATKTTRIGTLGEIGPIGILVVLGIAYFILRK